MKLRAYLASVAILVFGTGAAYAWIVRLEAAPFEFDPANTFLVQAEWLAGIGCPTGARISHDGSITTGSFSDPACETGDLRDRRNEGLLLVKTGPTDNFAAAGVEIKGARGEIVTELGYDIRKPGSLGAPAGSHCGKWAPRFDITPFGGGAATSIGCSSPPPVVEASGDGWLRLRWIIPAVKVESLAIVFDEGQDTGPDNFGLAVLDNIDVNDTLVGAGPVSGTGLPPGDVEPTWKETW